MSRMNRRVLAVAGVIAALWLALPAPAQAAGLWSWDPADAVARMCSWLEGLGLLPQEATPGTQRISLGQEKEGSLVDPNGKPTGTSSTSPPASIDSDEGSMVEPNG